LMLRKPKSPYEQKRSNCLLKVKRFFEAEGKVVGYKGGENRLVGMMGALEVVTPSGLQLSVGTGFTDAQRKKPPKKGTVVTFKFQELSDDGKPRFAVFLRERTDITWDEVCELAKKVTPFTDVKKPTRQLKKQHTILFSTIPSRDEKTGQKIVTSDDEHSSDEEPTSTSHKSVSDEKSSTQKPKCKYGPGCYRTSKSHVSKYSHDPKNSTSISVSTSTSSSSSSSTTTTTTKIACKFGKQCYQKSSFHLEHYSHDLKDEEEPVNHIYDADTDEENEAKSEKGEEKEKEKEKEKG